MASLYDYLASSEPLQGHISNTQEFEPHHDEAIAVDMVTPTLETALGVKGTIGGIKAFNSIRPFLGDIWNGRGLLFHKPFRMMSKEEFKNYGNMGKNFYKNFLQKNPLNIKDYGKIQFGRHNRGKDKTFDMEQYPFLRYRINNATKINRTNTKNELDREYDIFENKHNGNLYNYIIEDIKDKGKRYKMMKKIE